MQPGAFKRYKFSGEHYKFVREQVGSTSRIKYYFSDNILLTAGLDANNRMIIKSDRPIMIGELIRNIKDANNDLILDDMIWQISSLQPTLNAFNTIDSYTMRAIKYSGENF
jgi:hypothetical protein